MELDKESISDLKEIYRDANCRTRVFFAKLRLYREQLDVAVKTISCSGRFEVYNYIEECLNQLRLDSPNVCRIYGWVVKPSEVSIVMEKLGYDLSKEIALRHKADYPYTEEEILGLLKDLVQVFAALQRGNISHNDIKAENIFVQKLAHGKVVFKVGDFGSASKAHRLERALTGTPLYLSPHLKAEYQRFLLTRERRETSYNPFKSDVYSLGVTVIYLAELACPNDLMETVYLQERLSAHLAAIRSRYPRLAGILAQMLITDESKRYDFLDLEAVLRDQFPETELETDTAESSSELKTSRFVADYHELLNRCYEREDWELMKALFRTHADALNWLRFESRLLQCPHCASIQGRARICSVCGRPTGLACPYIRSYSSYPSSSSVIMANFQALGEQFVTIYYTHFDSSRDNLRPLYNEYSMLTFEGEQYRGVESIMTKLKSLSFQTVKHQISTMDCQPSSTPNGIIVFVSGFMQMDQDNPFKFSQVFHLNQDPNSGQYFVFNDMFRLALG